MMNQRQSANPICLSRPNIIGKWTNPPYLISSRLEQNQIPARTWSQRLSVLGIHAYQPQREQQREDCPKQRECSPKFRKRSMQFHHINVHQNVHKHNNHTQKLHHTPNSTANQG
uniref:Uncharacterized protein n=1 Tax=Opuntia streptacantha TaxID=393608 RepID=A0A7C8Z5I6_OPUST